MLKFFTISLGVSVLLAGCETTSQPGSTSSAGRAVWVEGPTGSHIGSGFVHVPGAVTGNNEPALITAVQSLNSVATKANQRAFVLSAVTQVSGASESQFLTQERDTHLQLGDLLAYNLLARNNDPKARQIASARAQGKTWTQLAGSNGSNIAALAQAVERANSIAANLVVASSGSAPSTDRTIGVLPQGNSVAGGRPTTP